MRCRPCPYEEGTESGAGWPRLLKHKIDADLVPMKRELKEVCARVAHDREIDADLVPMKRELEKERCVFSDQHA